MDEADLVLRQAQRLHKAVDTVAGQAEDGVDSPRKQAFYKDIRGSHESSLGGMDAPGVHELGRAAQQGRCLARWKELTETLAPIMHDGCGGECRAQEPR